MEAAIQTFSLDLQGLRVLTEAATGYYSLTPLIAALAGARQVYALTRDSHYGSANQIGQDTMGLARRWGISDRLEVFSSREDQRVKEADIVTNLGFIRPLDSTLLKRLPPGAVIPLMWEAWEYRPGDLDRGECRRLGIPVLGTNEHHPDLRTLEYIGPLAVKLLFMLDIEVFQSHAVVLGSGEFAENTAATLRSAGATVSTFSPKEWAEGKVRETLRVADAIVIVEHHDRRMLIGSPGTFRAEDLYSLNPRLSVAHICGGVDRSSLEKAGFRCTPGAFAPPGYMSRGMDYLGPKPLVDLHTAGLKVGELMWRRKQVLHDAQRVEQTLAEECPLCQILP
jgi:hypothetical protein